MKLIKQHQGEYRGETTIDGMKIILEVSSLNDRGFSYSYYVNGKLTLNDGWYGLRLKDIKRDIDSQIESAIDDYKNPF